MFFASSSRILFLFSFLLFRSTGLSAQTKLIDSSVYNKWSWVSAPAISNDGKYALYCIENGIHDQKKQVIMSTDGSWKLETSDMASCGAKFSSNSRYCIWRKRDTLMVLTLGKSMIRKKSGVESFELSKGGQNQWLAYRLKSPAQQLIVLNLSSQARRVFANVKFYQFSSDKKSLLVESEIASDSSELCMVDLSSGKSKIIHKSNLFTDVVWSRGGEHVAFISGKEKQAYVYENQHSKIYRVASKSACPENTALYRLNRVSNDGKRLFVTFKHVLRRSPKTAAVNLNIWSYKDRRLQSEQVKGGPDMFHDAIICIENSEIIYMSGEDEVFSLNQYANTERGSDEWGVVTRSYMRPGQLDVFERNIMSTINGNIIPFNQPDISFSPGGRFVVYFDHLKGEYYSYELKNRILRPITSRILTTWRNDSEDDRLTRGEIAAWTENDQRVFIYDQYDIWEIDPLGADKPLNLTNGYGRKDSIVFTFASENNGNEPFRENEEILFSAFDRGTKENGFFQKEIGVSGDPLKLIMAPYAFLVYNPEVYHSVRYAPLLKASNSVAYVVTRQSANESPNYFITRDFRHFKNLSNLYPEKAYNWYRSELHEWKIQNGPRSQGILYKPDNFDPKIRYPVIIYFYQKMSDNLHAYIFPRPSSGELNIPWFVSNGYLVFSIDMHYVIDDLGGSIVGSVTAAADYIGKLPYVNRRKIGFQGMSWGGYQSNYILTRTNVFAAGCGVAGASDLVSYVGGVDGGGRSFAGMFEFDSYYKQNSTLWENPARYISNSPVFHLKHVSTPYLLMHTSVDGSVPFSQALEMYNGLRRNGKKVWLLEYTDGNHGVFDRDARDFDLRIQQFFDYYLKDLPPPQWMTVGRPAKLNPIEDRLDLDTSGRVP